MLLTSRRRGCALSPGSKRVCEGLSLTRAMWVEVELNAQKQGLPQLHCDADVLRPWWCAPWAGARREEHFNSR